MNGKLFCKHEYHPFVIEKNNSYSYSGLTQICIKCGRKRRKWNSTEEGAKACKDFRIRKANGMPF